MAQESDRTALYIAKAKEMEGKYGIKICVIRKRKASQPSIPWMTPEDGLCMFVIEPQSNNGVLGRKIYQELDSLYINVQLTCPVSEWVKMVRADPTRIRNGLGGLGFIVPFFFNDEVYGNYAREFQRTFKTEFGAQLKQAIITRASAFRESRKRLVEEHLSMVRKTEERATHIIGPIEEAELTDALVEMAEDAHKNRATIILAFDRSGRPLGVMLRHILKDAYGKSPELFFVDPTVVRQGLTPMLKKKFERECPRLVKKLPGASVVVVDDQVWQGHSLSCMSELLEQYHPKKLTVRVLSHFPSEPPPSWRGKPGVGIRDIKGSFIGRGVRDNERKKVVELRRKMSALSSKTARIIRSRRKP
jgi:adenine/guanine phosphoribosyltransferase-like PRPP-binding protein